MDHENTVNFYRHGRLIEEALDLMDSFQYGMHRHFIADLRDGNDYDKGALWRYLRDFRTMRFGLGMRTGKSRWVVDNATSNDLIISGLGKELLSWGTPPKAQIIYPNSNTKIWDKWLGDDPQTTRANSVIYVDEYARIPRALQGLGMYQAFGVSPKQKFVILG